MRLTVYAIAALVMAALVGVVGYQQYRIQGMHLDAAKKAEKQAQAYAASLKDVADRQHA